MSISASRVEVSHSAMQKMSRYFCPSYAPQDVMLPSPASSIGNDMDLRLRGKTQLHHNQGTVIGKNGVNSEVGECNVEKKKYKLT